MVSKKDIERFDKDNELWDSKQLGASAEHAVQASEEDDKALDDALGLQLLSFRIQKSIIEQLKQLAKLEGIGYQPLMRKVLNTYVRDNEHMIESSLTPSQAAEKADHLFADAIKLRDALSNLELLSKDRIAAESNYSRSLTKANNLFRQAIQKSADEVLKSHIKLRLDQINTLCQTTLETKSRKRFGKAV
ncbi:MAG: hypothetical protein K2X29_01185 [Candidatus Obscuribacterales bacterium]|nr:hypothetical protein [Candidatus Obscuribacterales bacterium]